MAPILQIIAKLLFGSALTTNPPPKSNNHGQAPISDHADAPISQKGNSLGTVRLSAISPDVNRTDVYGTDLNTETNEAGNVSHKWWDGYQWGPSASTFENLGGAYFFGPPAAVSWGKDRMDIFTISASGSLQHKYYDSTAWKPSLAAFETLAEGFDPDFDLAVTSCGPNRLDVFGLGKQQELTHKYWDGSSWQPKGKETEDLGGYFSGSPAAVSWGKDRHDVFALTIEGEMFHTYFDGKDWSDGEILDFKGVSFYSEPTAISWGENRLDVFAMDGQGVLQHIAWDGRQWLPWEAMGDVAYAKVAALSWSPNRLDIYALADDTQYQYKHWDGSQWNPSVDGWYEKGGEFKTAPALVSWGKNRLDAYGVDVSNNLLHQTWYGSGWYPAANQWENLGGKLDGLAEAKTGSGEL